MDNTCKSDQRVWIIAVLIFFASLFLIIGLTAPGLQVNDEWITVNQLHQLIQGHQVLTNEGKYGTVMGEMIGYFAYRHNILGYSLFLPIMSYVPLLFIVTAGDFFRFWIILFWVSIPLIMAVLIQWSYPQYSKIWKIPVIFPGLLISGVLLFTNIQWYYPFPSLFASAPIESAAVVLMENGIFAISCSLIFGIGWMIYTNVKRAIWFTIAIVCCSSYLFWATNAKDHILTIFLLCCMIFSFLTYYKSESKIMGALAFLFCGLLLWIRPEIGFTVMILVTAQYLYIHVFKKQLLHLPLQKILCIVILPLFFFAGAAPFFANNYILTKNFFYPPYLEYETTLTSKTAQDISNVDLNATISSDYANNYLNQNRSLNYIHLLIKYFTPTSTDILKDFWRISFFPPNGSVGLLVVSPFIFVGLISVLMLLIARTQITDSDIRTIILCGLISIALFLAYIRNLPSQPISEGIGPDMRYYSPLYLPMGMIAFISMKYWNQNPITPTLWLKTLIVLFVGTPILIISLLIIQPWGGGIYSFNFVFSLINMGLMCLLLTQMVLIKVKIWYLPTLELNLIGILLISFTWQIMLVFLYSIAKFDGFTFWIPLTEQLFTQFIIPVG